MPSLPSRPVTFAAHRAKGSVKLPNPQKKSATLCSGFTSNKRTARDTMVSFKAWFTCVKSVGLKTMSVLNSEWCSVSLSMSAGFIG